MNDEMSPEQRTPAELRLDEHLDIVRANPPQASRSLSERIVRRARWQSAIRAPLHALGLLAAAVTDAVGVLIRGDRATR